MDLTKISLYLLSIAFITNHYKLSDLKQYKSLSYISVGQKYSRDLRVKMKVLAGLCSFGAKGENPASRGLLSIYLAHGPLPSFPKTAMSHLSYPSSVVTSLCNHR